MKHRAYSLFEIKGVDEARRHIEGIASTPTPDRMNDIVSLDGMEFKLPLPFLYQHNARQPIGRVLSAKKTGEGLAIKAEIAQDIAPFISEAWALIKAGLVPGLSIGFRSLEESWDRERGGFNFLRTELYEISAVTIPANEEATISAIKSADALARAVSGSRREAVFLSKNLPGVPGLTAKGLNMKTPTVAEQIANYERTVTANELRIDELISRCTNEGRTWESEEKEEHDNLKSENARIVSFIADLKEREKQLIAKAAPVQQATDPESGARARRNEPIQVKSNLPKGIGMARVAIAKMRGHFHHENPVEVAKRLWPDQPEVALYIKAAVEAGDTTTSGWASQLIPAAIQTDFLELLRPRTILGRITGLREVPFNVAVPVQTGGGTYGWVGEGGAKPVTSLTFSSVTLRWAKAAGIIVITQELAKFSSPSAEMIVRDDMLAGCARFLDTQFVSTAAEVSNVSPAGILNGISAITPSGTTAAAFRVDMNNMLNNFIANNVDPATLRILMSATQALALSLMVTDLNAALFPNINVNGGTILGFPAVVSENVGTRIVGLVAQDILFAEEGGINIDVSTEASVEMSTTPIAGDTSPITGAVLKSLWQNNLVGLRVEKFNTWKRGRDSAVEYINGNAYVPS